MPVLAFFCRHRLNLVGGLGLTSSQMDNDQHHGHGEGLVDEAADLGEAVAVAEDLGLGGRSTRA